MRIHTLALSVCLSTLAPAAGAQALKGDEILRNLSGEWSYVLPPSYAPDPNFCKFRWVRWTITGETFEHRSIVSDKPDDFYLVIKGKIARLDGDSILIALDPIPNEPPATTKVWMRDQDFAVVEIQTVRRNPPLYLKRCIKRELVG